MTKTEKVPILGTFSPKTILMFRVELKKIRVGRETGTTHIFYLSQIYSEMTNIYRMSPKNAKIHCQVYELSKCFFYELSKCLTISVLHDYAELQNRRCQTRNEKLKPMAQV